MGILPALVVQIKGLSAYYFLVISYYLLFISYFYPVTNHQSPITFYLEKRIVEPRTGAGISDTGDTDLRGIWVLGFSAAIRCSKKVIKAACISLSSIVLLS
ncbi:hypothetical protein [Sphaerospermopsis reniformis]|uniref:hypothetical protein n=1 Tax=Sphaerospermopsis reniformis TaxID=531300 RepID=UPI001396A771|nr:hypothetical protein [Sphaerospermopsis reniformis]